MGNPESAVHLQAYQLLLDARDLVVKGWSSGAAARDGDGRAVDPSHASARSWSLAGALEAASARQDKGRDGGKAEASARAVASAALEAAISGNPSENEVVRRLEGAIRELAAGEGRQFAGAKTKANDRTIAVRCLRCGSPYRKQASHEVLETTHGCPTCGYQGWSFAEQTPPDREHAD